MKTIQNLIIKSFVVVMVFVVGCLPLQENFRFDPGPMPGDPFADMTAWEFIQSRDILTTNAAGVEVLDNEEFNYFIAAVKRAGFEEFFSGNHKERTYLILNNSAFLGNNGIIRLVTGSATVRAGETPDEVMARANLNVLQNILRYHIIDAYVDQVPTLFVAGQWYIFQTFLPGPDGLIGLIRDDRYRIFINAQPNNANPIYGPAPLPTSARARPMPVRNHNYVFKNGIGHVINGYVQNRPFI